MTKEVVVMQTVTGQNHVSNAIERHCFKPAAHVWTKTMLICDLKQKIITRKKMKTIASAWASVRVQTAPMRFVRF